jgi:hypothetical protein
MEKKFYLDTAIWRDYFEDWKDSIRPLGEFAFQFLKNCEKKGCKVLYSGLVVYELKQYYSDGQIKQVFSSFKDFLVEVSLSNEQISEARKVLSSIKGTHLKDVLHAILARDNCAVMITRDKHFDVLTDFVNVAKPEDIHF